MYDINSYSIKSFLHLNKQVGRYTFWILNHLMMMILHTKLENENARKASYLYNTQQCTYLFIDIGVHQIHKALKSLA